MTDEIEIPIVDALVREWSGHASVQDRELLAEWFAEKESRQRDGEKLKAIWNVAGRVNPKPPIPTPDIRERVWAKITVAEIHDKPALRNNAGFRTWWLVSASAALIVLAVAVLNNVRIAPKIVGPKDVAVQHTYRTKAGQRARVVLPDGSLATLNAASTITYSKAFGQNTREVELSGEALFSVVHNTGAPFVVNAGASTTRVLGTVFAVRYYPSDRAANVLVTEGKVGVRHRAVEHVGDPALASTYDEILSVGDAASLTRDNKIMVQRNVDISRMLGWTSGNVYLVDTPLHEAIDELSRWYGIKIRVSNPELLVRRISTAFTNENSRQAMQLVALALRAHVTWQGDVVTFSENTR